MHIRSEGILSSSGVEIGQNLSVPDTERSTNTIIFFVTSLCQSTQQGFEVGQPENSFSQYQFSTN